jgi:hypothetical protein
MTLENGGNSNSESPETPKTPEQKMIEKYLSFQSSGTKQEKLTRAQNALGNENIRKYATALVEAVKQEGWGKVSETAESIKNAMLIDAKTLKIPVSVFGEDTSWVMLDLGQRCHYHTHPDEPGHIERDSRVNPFAETDEATNVRWDISDRQLAYQARRAYFSNHANSKEWRAIVDSNQELYAEALLLLGDKGIRGHLSFEQETKLGDALHRLAERVSESQLSPAAVPEEIPPAPAPADAPAEQTDTPQAVDVPANVNKETPNNAAGNAGAEVTPPHDDQNTIGREMRDSIRSVKLDKLNAWRNSEAGRLARQETMTATVETEEERILQDNNPSHGGEKYVIKQEPITLGYLGKMALVGTIALPIIGGYYAGRELVTTTWQSLKNMFGVLIKLRSFKDLSKNAESGKAHGEKHANDNHKPDTHDTHKAGEGHGHENHGAGHPDAGGHHDAGGHGHAAGHATGGHGKKGGHKKPTRKGKKAARGH